MRCRTWKATVEVCPFDQTLWIMQTVKAISRCDNHYYHHGNCTRSLMVLSQGCTQLRIIRSFQEEVAYVMEAEDTFARFRFRPSATNRTTICFTFAASIDSVLTPRGGLLSVLSGECRRDRLAWRRVRGDRFPAPGRFAEFGSIMNRTSTSSAALDRAKMGAAKAALPHSRSLYGNNTGFITTSSSDRVFLQLCPLYNCTSVSRSMRRQMQRRHCRSFLQQIASRLKSACCGNLLPSTVGDIEPS